MNAKELLQINEQMMAFNTVMSGALKEEMTKAQATLDALGTAEEHATKQTKLDLEKAGFESYKASVQAIFDETKADIASDKEKIKKARELLEEKAKGAQAKQDDVATKQAQVAVSQVASQVALDQAWEKFNAESQALAQKQASVDGILASAAAREAMVQAKLDAISAAAA